MKFLMPAMLLALLCSAWPSFAADEVTTQGQAYTACKASAYEQLEDVKAVKMLMIRHHKKTYKVTLRVRQGDQSRRVVCRVSRDGSVAFSEK